MKKATREDFLALQFGERVQRIINGNHKELRFVGFMPGASDYLIFSSGEYLAHLYVNPVDGTYKGEWYVGGCDDLFIGQRLIEYHENEIEAIKQIYAADDEQ